jgi:E3 ubiquitin-protein ligase HUWE1
MSFGRFKNIFLIVFIFLILGMLGFIIYRNKDPSNDSSTVQRNLPDSQSKSSDTKRNYEETKTENSEKPKCRGNNEEPRNEEPRSNETPRNSEQPNNFDSNAESNSTNIPQDDSLPGFQSDFFDSEVENSSSFTLQKRSFSNFEEKINFLRAELNSRNRNQRYGLCRINVNRDTVLQESMDRILSLSHDDLRLSPRISFVHEEGVDSGGLTKEWLELIISQALNPDLGYFKYTNDKNTTFRPFECSDLNPDHLEFFKFVGRILGMTIINNCNVGAYFDKSVFKSILKRKCSLSDLEETDVTYYNSLVAIRDQTVADSDLTFEHEISELGDIKTIDLIPNGRNIDVTDKNKAQFIDLKVQVMLYGVIKAQLNALRDGLYEVIDTDLISIFTESELELLICGNPVIDVEDWKNNTEYSGLSMSSNLIRWFWRAVEEFSQSERAKLLHFVTGTSKVPSGGFANLQSNGVETNFRISRSYDNTSSLPSAHTCFNRLDLPDYRSYEILKSKLLLAINEGSEGFGIA